MVMTKEQIGAAFRAARLRHNLRLHDVVRISDVQQSVVYSFEVGKRDPYLFTLCAIANVYGLNMDSDLFAERLRARRHWLGLTQEQVAERADIPNPLALSSYEHRVHQPRATTYLRLCAALEVDPVQFLEAKDERVG